MNLRAAAALAALALAPLALASPLAVVHVHIESFSFSPRDAFINVGDAVEWDNHDDIEHTATENNDAWDTGILELGQSATIPFASPGTWAYRCLPHPTMRGRVVVSDPAALPDLRPASVNATDLVPGLVKQLTVSVRNDGAHWAAASTLQVDYLYHGQRHAIGEAGVRLLGPGEAVNVTLNWTTQLKLGDFALEAVADSRDVVAEANEGNNVLAATVSVLVSGVPGIDLTDP